MASEHVSTKFLFCPCFLQPQARPAGRNRTAVPELDLSVSRQGSKAVTQRPLLHWEGLTVQVQHICKSCNPSTYVPPQSPKTITTFGGGSARTTRGLLERNQCTLTAGWSRGVLEKRANVHEFNYMFMKCRSSVVSQLFFF